MFDDDRDEPTELPPAADAEYCRTLRQIRVSGEILDRLRVEEMINWMIAVEPSPAR